MWVEDALSRPTRRRGAAATSRDRRPQRWIRPLRPPAFQAPVPRLPAAGQAAEMRSVRAVEYVRDFERKLEPYRDAAPVRTYRDRIAAYG